MLPYAKFMTKNLGEQKIQTLRLNTELIRLVEIAAEADKTLKSEVYRTAVSQYVGRRAMEDEDFAKEVRSTMRRVYAQQVEAVRETFGPNSLLETDDQNMFPEYMREPESDGQPLGGGE